MLPAKLYITLGSIHPSGGGGGGMQFVGLTLLSFVKTAKFWKKVKEASYCIHKYLTRRGMVPIYCKRGNFRVGVFFVSLAIVPLL